LLPQLFQLQLPSKVCSLSVCTQLIASLRTKSSPFQNESYTFDATLFPVKQHVQVLFMPLHHQSHAGILLKAH